MGVYSFLLLLVLVVGAPYWLVRMATSGRYRAGLAGRLGRVPEELRVQGSGARGQGSGGTVWVHAVSVGEVMAAVRLVEELRAALPGWVIAVSTTTETGQRLAKERLAGSPVFYMPLDFRWVVRRYLAVIRPKLVVTMESELWPRLIEECAAAGIPMAVVNARVSDRSFPRYMRLRGLWQPLLRKISLFLAQSAETAERLVKMGAVPDRVRVTGNLKYDVRVGAVTGMTRRIADLFGGYELVVAGSTHTGEEEVLLEVWREVRAGAQRGDQSGRPLLMIAPRHPDRFQEVVEIISKKGCGVLRCSELAEKGLPEGFVAGDFVLVLDTIGDLASVYSLASVAFMGGSLVAKGGHNPLEAAQFGVPVVIGESYENFREMVELMRAQDAIRVVVRAELAGTLVKMLGSEGRAVGERGRMVFEGQSGATGRTVQALLELLPARGRRT
jgi:3-deoxy-D-manno-octulosonic-acid transferase